MLTFAKTVSGSRRNVKNSRAPKRSWNTEKLALVTSAVEKEQLPKPHSDDSTVLVKVYDFAPFVEAVITASLEPFAPENGRENQGGRIPGRHPPERFSSFPSYQLFQFRLAVKRGFH